MEPKTDKAKVTWLWKRRDEDASKIAGLESRVTGLLGTNERLMSEGHELRHENGNLHAQIRVLGVEVNEARAAAASAVHAHRELMRE